MNNVGLGGRIQVHNPPCCKYNTEKEENDLMSYLAAILKFFGAVISSMQEVEIVATILPTNRIYL